MKKEYIKEILCRFLGIHYYGEWENTSRFIDTGIGFNFGWIARWRKTCLWCGHKKEKKPFLKDTRTEMIEENSKNNKKYF